MSDLKRQLGDITDGLSMMSPFHKESNIFLRLSKS